jgi:hypothetical protein
VTIFSTLAGLLFGSWLEGTSGWVIGSILMGSVTLLLGLAAWTRGQRRRVPSAAEEIG